MFYSFFFRWFSLFIPFISCVSLFCVLCFCAVMPAVPLPLSVDCTWQIHFIVYLQRYIFACLLVFLVAATTDGRNSYRARPVHQTIEGKNTNLYGFGLCDELSTEERKRKVFFGGYFNELIPKILFLCTIGCFTFLESYFENCCCFLLLARFELSFAA